MGTRWMGGVWLGLVASAAWSGCSDDDDGAVPRPPRDTGASAVACDVPTDPEALRDYLRTFAYKGMEHEPEIHASSGPHGGKVLTYVNDVLAASAAAGNDEHPACAASIKELFLGNDEVSGWAVFVKNYADSDEGRGFFWFETTSTAADHEPDFAGQGLGVCTGCHAAGQDYVRTAYPFE